MKPNEILKMLRKDGWKVIHTRGSHAQLKHPTKPGKVTVPIHKHEELDPKTEKSILNQAGLAK